MKFGKHIQKRQLDIPEYAASFVDYKALKKLIKQLSTTPVITAQNAVSDPQASLKANKATFFFRLEGELDKVNTCYLQKEAELKLRLNSLLEKKRAMQAQATPILKSSSRYIAIEEGFRQFSNDLNKLQQFIEVNGTAFAKILKKWDKTSKSREKEIYISRAVEVQPCFNRDVISDLSDQATTNLQDFAAWAEGEEIQYASNHIEHGYQQAITERRRAQSMERDDGESAILQAITAGNISILEDWANRIKTLPDARDRVSRVFLSTMEEAPDFALDVLLRTGLVDFCMLDEVSSRNILHKAAISGRLILIDVGLEGKADMRKVDVYGRIPLHYACMHGNTAMIRKLIEYAPDTIDFKDHDNFTPLVHAIVGTSLDCVQTLLAQGATVNPASKNDHIPLNLACQHGSTEVVRLLLERRPQILPDAEGLYPQHLVARSADTPELLLMLSDYGADLDQPDQLYQWTPLFHAASEGKVQCLRLLLERGVDVNALDEKKLSASYYATWEGHLRCMALLAEASLARQSSTSQSGLAAPPPSVLPSSTPPGGMSMDPDSIPEIELPPPIISVKRYGHNFLEHKTFVIISFGELGMDPIAFHDNNYPAARLTVSSKSSNLIPRNIQLPIQDDDKFMSFQIDDLNSFSMEFDIYPTFGAKVIARTEATSQNFAGFFNSSTGICCLPLYDPRVRSLGQIRFQYQVIKPFSGTPLEITHFATYWKANSQRESSRKSYPSALVTGSSLSGNYARLYVQMTSDGTAILYPHWKIDAPVPNGSIKYQLYGLGRDDLRSLSRSDDVQALSAASANDIPQIHATAASSLGQLSDALQHLSPEINVELHVLYPSNTESKEKRINRVPDINDCVDGILSIVFDDARRNRERSEGLNRSIVFTSYNSDVCMALNWKQPNCK